MKITFARIDLPTNVTVAQKSTGQFLLHVDSWSVVVHGDGIHFWYVIGSERQPYVLLSWLINFKVPFKVVTT